MRPEERVNILMVDDRPENLLALEAVLSELDENVVKAPSGEQALRELLQRDFAVILLDVNMPGMDGFETATMIRQRKASESTPIIFVTAVSPTDTEKFKGYALGAVDYIFTPVVPEILKAKVSVFIDLHRKTNQVTRQATWLREEAERRANDLETRLRSMLNRLNVGVFRADLQGRLVEANRACLRLLGVGSLEEANTFDLLKLSLPVGAGSDREDSPEEPRLEDGTQLTRPDGTSIWISTTRTVTAQADGQLSIEGLLEDITARKRAEEALIGKAEELARSNADLEQFAYVASHDLQEPLRMVSSFSELLALRYGSKLDSKADEYIGFVLEGARRMHNLIHDLLAFSRVGSRDRALAPQDSGELMQQALFNLRTAIDESHAVVTHDKLPVIHGDPALLVQLFQNLVGNAIKFRGAEPPSVHISASPRGPMWEFVVSDNGIGIAPKYHELIFKVFQRLHTREQHPGTGIGLALCRRVADRHGGRIWVESEEGIGSRFHVTLPAAVLEEPARESQSGTAKRA